MKVAYQGEPGAYSEAAALRFNPNAETVLRAGDRMRLFGLPHRIDALLAEADVLSE